MSAYLGMPNATSMNAPRGCTSAIAADCCRRNHSSANRSGRNAAGRIRIATEGRLCDSRYFVKDANQLFTFRFVVRVIVEVDPQTSAKERGQCLAGVPSQNRDELHYAAILQDFGGNQHRLVADAAFSSFRFLNVVLRANDHYSIDRRVMFHESCNVTAGLEIPKLSRIASTPCFRRSLARRRTQFLCSADSCEYDTNTFGACDGIRRALSCSSARLLSLIAYAFSSSIASNRSVGSCSIIYS